MGRWLGHACWGLEKKLIRACLLGGLSAGAPLAEGAPVGSLGAQGWSEDGAD